jgi:hypothetical protein
MILPLPRGIIARATAWETKKTLPCLHREVLQRCPPLDARIVDQDIDRPKIPLNPPDAFNDSAMIGDIERLDGHFNPLRPQPLRRTIQLGPVAPIEHDRRPSKPQPLRQSKPDPLTGPGHQRTPALQAEE